MQAASASATFVPTCLMVAPRRGSALLRLEALRRCTAHPDGGASLQAAFRCWIRAVRGLRAAAAATSSRRPQQLHGRKTLQLLEALRRLVAYEPLSDVHAALLQWRGLVSLSIPLQPLPPSPSPERRVATFAAAQSPNVTAPAVAASGKALVSVTAADLQTLMDSVATLQRELKRQGHALSRAEVAQAERNQLAASLRVAAAELEAERRQRVELEGCVRHERDDQRSGGQRGAISRALRQRRWRALSDAVHHWSHACGLIGAVAALESARAGGAHHERLWREAQATTDERVRQNADLEQQLQRLRSEVLGQRERAEELEARWRHSKAERDSLFEAEAALRRRAADAEAVSEELRAWQGAKAEEQAQTARRVRELEQAAESQRSELQARAAAEAAATSELTAERQSRRTVAAELEASQSEGRKALAHAAAASRAVAATLAAAVSEAEGAERSLAQRVAGDAAQLWKVRHGALRGVLERARGVAACVWACARWRLAVASLLAAERLDAAVARLGKSAEAQKRSLREREAEAARAVERGKASDEQLERVKHEHEKTLAALRKDGAQQLARTRAELEKVVDKAEKSERAAVRESTSARAMANRLGERLKQALLQQVLQGRPRAERCKQLAAAVRSWRRTAVAMRRGGPMLLTSAASASGVLEIRTSRGNMQPACAGGATAPMSCAAGAAERATPLGEAAARPSQSPRKPEARELAVGGEGGWRGPAATAADTEPHGRGAADGYPAAAAPSKPQLPRPAAAERTGTRAGGGSSPQARATPLSAAVATAAASPRRLVATSGAFSRSAGLPSSEHGRARRVPSASARHEDGGDEDGAPTCAGGLAGNDGGRGAAGARYQALGAAHPMEEVARCASPRPTGQRGKGGGRTPLKAQPPTASELGQLRKLVSASYSAEGELRLDSVSLYSLGKRLGKGAFGAVKAGVHKLSGGVVAVKNFKKADVKHDVEAKAIEREIRILKNAHHQHIIRLYEVIDSPTNYYIVMECASNGDLGGHIERCKRLGEAEAARYYVQTVEAVAHCHEHGVIHRDIKPENLLLDVNHDIKLTDFGLSATVRPGQLLKVPCGTPAYSAPEIISRKEYDGTLSDAWSLGVLLYFMLAGVLPFSKESQIRAGDYAPRPEVMPPAALALITRLLVVRVDQRATLAEVRQHGWLLAWRATALRVPSRRFGLTYHEPDPALLARLDERFGLRAEHVARSLRQGVFNHATATYLLLEESADASRGDSAAPSAG